MSGSDEERGIDSVLVEKRRFAPPAEFAARARVKSPAEREALVRRAEEDPDGFWSEVAGALAWERRWSRVREGALPYVKWFVGGRLNVTVSCLDRHLVPDAAGVSRRDK